MSTEDLEKQLSGDRSNNQDNPLQVGLNLFLYDGVDALASMVQEYFTPTGKDSTYQYGICLHTEETDDPEKIRAWVRIPTEHGMIPVPRSKEDYDIFSMHAEVIASKESLAGSSPVQGQVLKVSLKNPGINVGYQTGEITEVMDSNVSFVAGGVGKASETFETCFFAGEPPSYVLPPSGETPSGGDSPENNVPTFKSSVANTAGVECGKVYKFADFAAQDLANMKTSQAGINLIHSMEGFREAPYTDANKRKLWTVGYGSKIDRRDADGAERFAIYKIFAIANGSTAAEADAYKAKLNKHQANAMFVRDLGTFEDKVKDLFRGVKLRQTQFDALVSVVYNAGTVYNTLKNAIKRNPDDPGIGAAFATHAITAEGKPLRGLIKRRQRELDLYFGKVSAAEMRRLTAAKTAADSNVEAQRTLGQVTEA
jgi:GH24 family phage-related lysozyme (muramidase)